MKILITGISGVGKTTIGRELKKKGYSVLDIDEDGFCYWKNKNNGRVVTEEVVLDQKFINQHGWFCDMEKLSQEVENLTPPVFIIGLPENLNDLLIFADKYILLKCSPEIFLQRIMERKDNDFGKESSAQKEILATYRDFENKMIKNNASVINTEKSIGEVVREIEEIL